MNARREEMRALRRLALPIIATNLGTMLMGMVDTMMVGHLGDGQSLAAVVLANVWISGTMLLGMGIVFGMDPIVTRAHGARDAERMGLALQRGVVIALVIGVLLAGLWTYSDTFLLALGQDPATAQLAHEYTQAQLWTAPFFMVFVALRQYLQGRGILAPVLWVTVIANVFNALFNWTLIYGKLGMPAMGLVGAGVATALTRGLMLAGLLAMVFALRLQRGAWVPWSRRALEPSGIWEVLHYGIPTGVQLSLEIWAFGYSTLMAGRLGNLSAAAHGVVLNMASMTFMVPLGISLAAVTRVGNLIGQGRTERAQTTAWVAFALGAAVMVLAATFFLAARSWLPTLYTTDLEVVALCATILPIAAAFQIFDGVQVVGSGILRGMGQTRPAAVFNLVGYWFLALPIGHWMAFETDLALRGVWWGLVIGLAVVAVCLLAWVHRRGPAHMAARAGR